MQKTKAYSAEEKPYVFGLFSKIKLYKFQGRKNEANVQAASLSQTLLHRILLVLQSPIKIHSVNGSDLSNILSYITVLWLL